MLMNIRELRASLYDMCQDEGSITAWAKKKGIAFSYVAAVIRGDSNPGNKLLKAMGKKKRFTDKKTTVMKFEDITN